MPIINNPVRKIDRNEGYVLFAANRTSALVRFEGVVGPRDAFDPLHAIPQEFEFVGGVKVTQPKRAVSYLKDRFCNRRVSSLYRITRQEVVDEINFIRDIFNGVPAAADVDALKHTVESEEARNPTNEETNWLKTLYQIRSDRARLDVEEAVIRDRLMQSISGSSGISGVATFKSRINRRTDFSGLRSFFPEAYELFVTESQARVLMVRISEDLNDE